MITVNRETAEALSADSRNFTARLLINGTTNVAGSIRSLRIYKGSCGAEEFNLGVVYCPYLEAVIDYENRTVDDLAGQEMLVQIGVNLGTLESPNYSYINIGYFTAIKPSLQGTLLSFTAYGRLATRFGAEYYNTATTPVSSVISEISSLTGVNITVKGGLDLTATVTGLSGWTCLETLQIIAGVVGGYVTEDNAGGIVLASFDAYEDSYAIIINELPVQTAPYTATDANDRITIEGDDWIVADNTAGNVEVRFSAGSVSGASLYTISANVFKTMPSVRADETVLTGITCYPSITAGDTSVTPYVWGDGKYEFANEYMSPEAFNKMVAVVGGYSYTAGSLDMAQGLPTLEPWDAIAYIKGDDRYIIPCMAIQITYDGGVAVNVASVGEVEEEETNGFAGLLSQRLARTLAKATEAQDVADRADDAIYGDDGLAEKVQVISGTVDIQHGVNPYVFIHTETDGGELNAGIKITDKRLSFMQNSEVEVAYIDTTVADGMLNIPTGRMESLKIGELEIFNLMGGIGIRRAN